MTKIVSLTGQINDVHNLCGQSFNKSACWLKLIMEVFFLILSHTCSVRQQQKPELNVSEQLFINYY